MMIDFKMVASAVALAALFSLNAEAKLYKWVDNNGTTHYGETIPAEYADKEAVKLEKGRIEKRADKRGNDGQKVDLKAKAEEKARIEATRRDNALVNTYSSEQEIDLARDRNLQQVNARTNSYTTLLNSAQDNLAALKQELAKLNEQGRKIPKSLDEDIEDATSRIAKLQKDLNASVKEMESVKARYASDKARYRELKGYTAQNNETAQQLK